MSASTRRLGLCALAVYALSIVLANWLIRNVGPIVLPNGDHLIPVGFGLAAPSGTLAAGATFVARDLVQCTIGKRWSLVIIPLGALVSAALDVHLALASGAAFLFAETVDFAVFTPLQRRGLVRAVFASEIVASLIDSLIFLGLAGIPFAQAFPGLMLCKFYVGLVAVPLTMALRGALAATTARRAVPARG